MHLTITNTGPEAEALGDPDGEFVTGIEPGETITHNSDAGVLIYGDKPSVRDQFETAAERLGAVVKHLISIIAGRKRQRETQGEALDRVTASVANHGANTVRAILGDGTTDVTIASGQTGSVSALGYVEFRELGTLEANQVDGGSQPAPA